MTVDVATVVAAVALLANVAALVTGPVRLARWMGTVDARLAELTARLDRLPCERGAERGTSCKSC